MKLLARVCMALGALGLMVTCAVYIDSYAGARQAVAAFERAADASQQSIATKAVPVTGQAATNLPPLESPEPQSTEINSAFTTPANDQVPVAVLTIKRLDLEVPVFPGTDRTSLNRGAGIVAGAAFPGEPGNVAVAAHRDSFFRPLKDIVVGDVIELRSAPGIQRFQVSEIFVTDPLDVSVLDATIRSTLTLITCYPFQYVGFAPDRYIVRAVPAANSYTRSDITNP